MSADDFLNTIYDSVTDDGAFARALAVLAERFGCPSAAFLYVDATRREADILLGYGLLTPEAQARDIEHYAALDPAPAAMARLPPGRATATGRLFSPPEWEASRFIQEFYRPLGLAEALGGPIAQGQGVYGVIAVQRGPDRPPFSDEEIADFEQLMPHVTRAVRLRRRFFELQLRSSALEAASENVACAILVLKPDRGIAHANQAARRILGRADCFSLDRAGRLFAREPAMDRKLQSAIEAAERCKPQILTVPAREAQAFYAVRVTRPDLTIARPVPTRVRDGEVLLTIHDPESVTSAPTQLFATVYDISTQAAQLLSALIRGQTLAEHAEQAGISVNTAKFHLKAAFQATGTQRQSDLIRQATALVRDIGGA